MRLFQDVPIQKKLRRITMLTTIVALLLTGIALIIYELVIYRSVMTRELMSLADVIGANSVAAVTFNDQKAAEQTLAALRKDTRITQAAIFTKEGNAFAVYRRQPLEDGVIPVAPSAEGSRIEGEHLIIFHSIILDKGKIGTLYIQAEMREVYARVQTSALIVLGVLLVSSLVALILASALEGVISQPILNLARTVTMVAEKQDYSVRATGSHRDELGQLIDGFNEMLAQIQQRDTALQVAQNQLEATVEHRTRQLQTALQQAEEASHHKSLFLSNMSHELRTPLNSIMGFAWLLQDPAISSLNQKQARFAKNITTSGEHLLVLINDLLDLTKVEAGKINLQLRRFLLQEAIEAALHAIQPQAEQKQQVLELAINCDMLSINADPTRFKQILYNLLSNAVKFTPVSGRIRVAARIVSDAGHQETGGGKQEAGNRDVEPLPLILYTQCPGECIEIAVSDTGVGIKSEDMAKLFHVFTQLEPALTKQFQGAGLGLALTKQLVELHGGAIWATSDGEGRGSTFTVRLPLAPQVLSERDT
jgi:two-component system, NarL family, sensor histidine kinase BarA